MTGGGTMIGMWARTGAALAAAFLAGCAEPDVILPGERLGLRAGAGVVEVNRAAPITLRAPVVNADWTHRGGDAQHDAPHPELNSALSLAFATDIGAGDSRGARITAAPVVAQGLIYTLDATSVVSAVGTNGAIVWQRDLTPPTDRRYDASGGGLAVANGVLYVNLGFGRTVAVDARSGAEIWTQDLDAPASAAPTVLNGIVYVVARDSRAWALDAATGRVRWQIVGTPSTTSFGGGAGAAVTSDIAVFPFPSGELLAAFPEGGLRRWSTVLAGERLGSAAGIAATDIGGDPVIDGDRLYAGNTSGRLAAIELATGERIWTVNDGVTGPVWTAGGSLFAVNDLNQLIRLEAATGDTIWRVQLPVGETRGLFGRRDVRFVHYGPILAGGRLVVASSDGVLRQFDPVSGATLAETAIPGGAASAPAIAGGALYVVSQDGALLAFR